MKKVVLILVLITVNFLSFSAKATNIASGDDCGNDCHWKISEDGVLNIWGNGDMTNFEDVYSVPWRSFIPDLTEIIVQDGITSIGDRAFSANATTSTLATITLPNSLENIGAFSFSSLRNLTEITLPSSLQTIGASAFKDCDSLTSLTIPSGVTLGDKIFIVADITNLYCGSSENDQAACAQSLLDSGLTQCQSSQSTNCVHLHSYDIINGKYVSDGHKYLSISDMQNNKIIPPRRIYTIEEANAVAGKVNRVSIRYR